MTTTHVINTMSRKHRHSDKPYGAIAVNTTGRRWTDVLWAYKTARRDGVEEWAARRLVFFALKAVAS